MGIDEIRKLKIAFVHDWLTGMRGGENVLEQMVEVLGPRDLYTLVSIKENLSDQLLACDIHTSFIQSLPWSSTRHQLYLPLFPLAIESFDLSSYDLVISTSHCVARGCVTSANTLHWSYLHTPVRYAWEFSEIYRRSLGSNPLIQLAWPLTMHYLRLWDLSCVNRVDDYSCNSENVRRRIRKCYGTDAKVLYPPADTSRFQINENTSRDYYLAFGALVPYKRVDLAIEAFARTNRRLIVAGSGPEESRLRELARGTSVEVIGGVDSKKVVELYQNAIAFLFPGEEDFGITPLEAQACGTPVIAFGRGGALETVVEGETGLFFQDQSEDSIEDALVRFENGTWDPQKCRNQALKFSNEVFRQEFENSLLSAWQDHVKEE